MAQVTLTGGFLLLGWAWSGEAQADVALCGSYAPPSSDAKALRQAPFAFDGVLISGRQVTQESGDVVLVSPFTFRVTSWLKRGSVVISEPSGAEEVRIWDGKYARLPDPLLRSYPLELTRRFPGELTGSRGQAWRIFGTNENGVNFTCSDLLGSHPLPGSEPGSPTVSADRVSPAGSPRGGTQRYRGLAFVLVVVTIVLVATTWLLARRSPSAGKR